VTRSDTTARELCIGRVVKAHGLKGGLTILPMGGDTLVDMDEVTLLSPKGERRASSVKTCTRLSGGALLMTFNGITGRDQAERFRGWQVVVDRDVLGELDEDEVYLADLVGCTLILPDGQTVGEVMGLYDAPTPYPMLIYQVDGRELLLPLPPENFLEYIPAERRLYIAWTPEDGAPITKER